MRNPMQMACNCLLLVIALTIGAPARSADRDVVDSVSALEVQAMLGDLGYTGSEIDEDGDIVVRMQGYNVLMLIGS